MKWSLLLIFTIITVVYLFIGAAIFQALESDNEQEIKTVSKERIVEFIQNNTCVEVQDLERFVVAIIKAYDQGVVVTNQTESADNWNLWTSFFFSATVITTIGYGHISPSTPGGRAFCVVYALIGIPLTGVFLTGIGQRLSRPIKLAKKQTENRYYKILISVGIAIVGFAALIFLPAFAFSKEEGWLMAEGMYYAVISLTTIGFGDYVAAQNNTDGRAWYQVLTILWIFLGLAWVAIILSDIGDFFKDTATKNTDRIKGLNTKKEFDAIRKPCTEPMGPKKERTA